MSPCAESDSRGRSYDTTTKLNRSEGATTPTYIGPFCQRDETANIISVIHVYFSREYDKNVSVAAHSSVETDFSMARKVRVHVCGLCRFAFPRFSYQGHVFHT